MKGVHRIVRLVGSVCVVWLSGCAAHNRDMLHFLPEREHEVSAIEYRVGIPDGIEITAPRIEEIDGEVQTIQPNGKISLALLGDVKVVGMTAKEIGAKLEVLLSKYYVDPKVGVRVVGFRSKKYYVYGQGMAAGPRPYTGRDTLFDAVMPSVADFLAWKGAVKVIRPSHGEEPPRTITVDVETMLRSGDWSKNILLEPNDIVYVPPTVMGWITNRIREVLTPTGPATSLYLAPADAMLANDYYDDQYRQAGRTRGRQIRR